MNESKIASTEIVNGTQTIRVGDTSVQINAAGSGPAILLLHGAGGPRTDAPFMRLLAQHGRVVAPTHPGFSGTDRGERITSIEDLAYLYLDLLETLDLRGVTLMGHSMGGWTAAEMAVRCAHRLARLILVDSVGIKTDPGEAPEPPKMFEMTTAEYEKMMFYDQTFAPDVAALTADQVRIVKQNRQTAQMYIGDPYLHNPKLRRYLHRIHIPTLILWGAHDGLVTPAYGEAYRASIPGARLEIIERAGHRPQLERPETFVRYVADFKGER